MNIIHGAINAHPVRDSDKHRHPLFGQEARSIKKGVVPLHFGVTELEKIDQHPPACQRRQHRINRQIRRRTHAPEHRRAGCHFSLEIPDVRKNRFPSGGMILPMRDSRKFCLQPLQLLQLAARFLVLRKCPHH